MSARTILRAFLIVAIIVLSGVAAVFANPMLALLVLGGPVAALSASPLVSLLLFALLAGGAYCATRRLKRARGPWFLSLLLVCVALTAVLSFAIHGESVTGSTVYEVPFEVTFEPSREAFDRLATTQPMPFVFLRWAVEGECTNNDGRIPYPLFQSDKKGLDSWQEWSRSRYTEGPTSTDFSRSTEPVRYTTTVVLDYPKKYLGYLTFHLSIQGAADLVVWEEARPSPGMRRSRSASRGRGEPGTELLRFALEPGERQLSIADSRGDLWKVKTRAEENKSHFRRLSRHLF